VAANVKGVEHVGELQCYHCHKWASGRPE
jgi:hypothetical protein